MSSINAYGAEKALTPMTMDGDWDAYRKHGYGPPPSALVRFRCLCGMLKSEEDAVLLI